MYAGLSALCLRHGSRATVDLADGDPPERTRGGCESPLLVGAHACRSKSLVALPATFGGAWPAITLRQRPPSSLPRLSALAANECGRWLGAHDPGIHQCDRESH